MKLPPGKIPIDILKEVIFKNLRQTRRGSPIRQPILLMFPLHRNSVELSIAFVATGILLVAAAVFFHFKD